MTHTKDVLAAELRKVGLDQMADAAAAGYYHDFLSPLAMPEMQLAADLVNAAQRSRDPFIRSAIMAVRTRHLDGEFDASKAESDEWAASPEGRAAFAELTRGR